MVSAVLTLLLSAVVVVGSVSILADWVFSAFAKPSDEDAMD